MSKDWKDVYRQETAPPQHTGYLVYNETIIAHLKNPRNTGEIADADGIAIVGDPNCGDHIRVYLSIRDDTVIEMRYKVFGCAAAIATSSILSEMVAGKGLDDALMITDDDVVETAGGIPARKAHCSLLGVIGLHTAIADYLTKKENLTP